MKLLYCPKCNSVFNLSNKVTKYCSCGLCGGFYKGDLMAYYFGPAISLGFDNKSIRKAIKNQKDVAPLGEYFTAFVIPKQCPTFIKINEE